MAIYASGLLIAKKDCIVAGEQLPFSTLVRLFTGLLAGSDSGSTIAG
jgi:hypothetical protein